MQRFLLTAIVALACCTSAQARDGVGRNPDKAGFETVVTTIGPIQLEANDNIRVCASDISLQLGKPRSNTVEPRWISAAVEVYRSTDLRKPVSRSQRDLVYQQGGGQCVEIAGSDFALELTRDESVLILVTSITTPGPHASPVTTGQMTSADPENSTASLLLPAVQSARESYSGGRRTPRKHCCAGWPPCAYGICED